MSGAPLVDLETGLVVGLVRGYHERERWLACGVPLAPVAERWPRLRERTADACYRRFLRAAYGFWERRFTPLEMTAWEREPLLGGPPRLDSPCFRALEEQEEPGDRKGEKVAHYHLVPTPRRPARGPGAVWGGGHFWESRARARPPPSPTWPGKWPMTPPASPSW